MSMAGIIPEYKKFAFKFFRIIDMIRTGNEYLFDIRFNRKSSRSDTIRIYRHFAITQYFKSQFFSSAVENIPAFFLEHRISWKEYHAHAIFAIGRQVKAKPDAFIKKEFMRGLNHNAGAISGIAFAAAGTPVFHILQDGQRIRDDLVTTYMPLILATNPMPQESRSKEG